jgi:hypothetical protein
MTSVSPSQKNPSLPENRENHHAAPLGKSSSLETQASSSARSLDRVSQKIHEALSQSPPEFDTHMSERMFAHVIGNGVISGEKELEGNVFADSIQYAADDLSRVINGEYGLSLRPEELSQFKSMNKELLEARSTMLDIYKIGDISDKSLKKEKTKQLCEKIIGQAKNLEPGQRILIPGGWSAEGKGHAIMYELEKTTDGKIVFHLFNSGDGLRYHEKREQNGETKHMCHLSWNLGQTDNLSRFEDVFSDLLALRAGTRADNPAQELYERILPQFSAKGAGIIKAKSDDPCWMSAQKSGICSWQSIMVWQKSKLGKETYRHVKLCSKVRAFRQFASQFPDQINHNPAIRSIAAQALGKTKRQLANAGLQIDGLIEFNNLKAIEKVPFSKTHKICVISRTNSSWAHLLDKTSLLPKSIYSDGLLFLKKAKHTYSKLFKMFWLPFAEIIKMLSAKEKTEKELPQVNVPKTKKPEERTTTDIFPNETKPK